MCCALKHYLTRATKVAMTNHPRRGEGFLEFNCDADLAIVEAILPLLLLDCTHKG